MVHSTLQGQLGCCTVLATHQTLLTESRDEFVVVIVIVVVLLLLFVLLLPPLPLLLICFFGSTRDGTQGLCPELQP